MRRAAVVPVGEIDGAIRTVRGESVVLDEDLARLYGVQTRVLVQAVKRNRERFPEDFLFRLTASEFADLRSETADKPARGGRRHAPYAFTEHGAVMVASVLNSRRAVEVSVFVVRAFVRMQRAMAGNRALTAKLAELEKRVATQDVRILALFDAMRNIVRARSRQALAE